MPERIRHHEENGRDALPLGVTVSGERINFSTVVPGGKTCRLLIYPVGEKNPCKTFEMQESLGDVRYIALEDIDSRQYEYNYEIDGEVTPDDYGKAFAGRSVWGKERDVSGHEVRGVLFQEEYDWEGDRRPFLSKDQVIAYSLHVRGFTKDTYSKVSAKGTFEGIVEKIPYLKDLGINQIQCMPIYEFKEIEEHGITGDMERHIICAEKCLCGRKEPGKSVERSCKGVSQRGNRSCAGNAFCGDGQRSYSDRMSALLYDRVSYGRIRIKCLCRYNGKLLQIRF